MDDNMLLSRQMQRHGSGVGSQKKRVLCLIRALHTIVGARRLLRTTECRQFRPMESRTLKVTSAGDDGVVSRSVVSVDGGHEMSVIALGAGCEVGRSCVVIEYRNRVVMFDCGIHPGHLGIGALPVFDAVDVSSVDLCLVTHFHLDHCGAVPYFVAKTPFKGTVVMTEPTRAIAKLLWADYAAMAVRGPATGTTQQPDTDYSAVSEGVLFDAADIDKAMSMITPIHFRQTLEFKGLGIRVSCFAAGHVLGACMFCVEIAGIRILYTGDFSREVDRHVPIAEIPDMSVHVLICESTYGIRVHEARLQREKRFIDSVLRIINRSGKCLMPVFALGRAQELLLILEEYWSAHPELHSIPIWYCSPMSYRSMPVFETFISVCGDYVKKIADSGANPFKFRFVKNARKLDDMKQDVYTEGTPCVVMAAPGMLQSGTSRSLFELWCQDPRNGVILTGYSVRGTVADELKKNPHSLQLQRDGPAVQIQSTSEMISFSAHSDFDQTFTFIEKLQPQIVILVHGERGEITRLSDKLKELRPNLAVFTPEILQRFYLRFPAQVQAKALGRLAERIIAEASRSAALQNHPDQMQRSQDNSVPGVLLLDSTATMPTLVDPRDLKNDVPTITLLETRYVEFEHPTLDPLVRRLQTVFEGLVAHGKAKIRIEDRVDVVLHPSHKELRVSWHSDPLSDLISDAIIYLAIECICTAEESESTNHDRRVPNEEELGSVLLLALRNTFEHVVVEREGKSVLFNVTVLVDAAAHQRSVVRVNLADRQVSGPDLTAVEKVRRFLRRTEHPLFPMPCFSNPPLHEKNAIPTIS